MLTRVFRNEPLALPSEREREREFVYVRQLFRFQFATFRCEFSLTLFLPVNGRWIGTYPEYTYIHTEKLCRRYETAFRVTVIFPLFFVVGLFAYRRVNAGRAQTISHVLAECVHGKTMRQRLTVASAATRVSNMWGREYPAEYGYSHSPIPSNASEPRTCTYFTRMPNIVRESAMRITRTSFSFTLATPLLCVVGVRLAHRT